MNTFFFKVVNFPLKDVQLHVNLLQMLAGLSLMLARFPAHGLILNANLP